MRIIELDKSYSEKKGDFYDIKGKRLGIIGLFIGLITLLVIFLFLKYNQVLAKHSIWFLILIIILAILSTRFIKKSEFYFFKRDIADKGTIGEKRIIQVLNESNFSDDYIAIKNYKIPETRIGDIDILLIGPKGIFILESKNYRGVFRVSETDVYKKLKFRKSYRLLDKEIIKQIKQQKELLEKFLERANIKIPIYPFLVFTSNYAIIERIIGHPGVFVCNYKDLPQKIFSIERLNFYNDNLKAQILLALGIKE